MLRPPHLTCPSSLPSPRVGLQLHPSRACNLQPASPAGEQNKPAARQDPAPSPQHRHPTELASAPVLRQLLGSPAGIWGAAAWPVLPAEPISFPQKEENGSRFNLGSLKSQTRCWHWQVGTGRAVARHRGPPHGGPRALEGWCRLPQPCSPRPASTPGTPAPRAGCCTPDPAPATPAGFRDRHHPARLLGTLGCPLPCAYPKGLDGFPRSWGNLTDEKAPSSPLHLDASPGV